MKRLVLILILQFGLFPSQTLSVAYEVTLRPNKMDKEMVESDLCLLDIDGAQSYYYSPLFNNEGKNLEIFKDSESLKAKALKALITTSIVKKDIPEHSISFYSKIDEVYGYQEKLTFNWKIGQGNDTLKILGYPVHLAKTSFGGREYVAYFSEDIPVNDGPYKFFGLPGLILKIFSTDGDYSFLAVGIESKKNSLNLGLGNTLFYTRKNFNTLMHDLAKDPSKSLRLKDQANGSDYKTFIGGKEVTNDEKYKLYNKMIWDFMKTHNNPIEKQDLWLR